ncbi:transcription elongation factor GreA [Sporosarcina sp. CAU 1771]
MKQKKHPMTEAGKKNLLKELELLQTDQRKKALEGIQAARKFCDFREDSEYEAAITGQAQIEERIHLVKEMLQHAELITESELIGDRVVLGVPVTFKELPDGDEETYTIIGVAEADPLNGTISNDSPLAKGLLGRAVEDVVDVPTPAGAMRLQIVRIG